MMMVTSEAHVVLTQNERMTETYLNVSAGALGMTRVPKDHPDFDVIVESIQNYPADASVICDECHTTSPAKYWLEAVEEPLKFFETENMCHCGGELWMDQLPGSNRFAWTCDNCGWIKPNAFVSGGEQML
jgi:hypothetical protein